MTPNDFPLVHSSHKEFVEYYSEKSLRPEAIRHFHAIQRAILRVLATRGEQNRKYDVLDVGCNAGTQCAIWAEAGHRVNGLDINEPLLELARERARGRRQSIDYRLGTATVLPWPDQCMDVCIALELLEHVEDWKGCMEELDRVLRPGGVMFLSTTNALCPKQSEFNLPGYSWYPGPMKRHFERLAITSRPGLANFAKFPAVHWFTPYSLKAEFGNKGYRCFDRFDLVDTSEKSALAGMVVKSVRGVRLLRWLGFLFTEGTMLLALKTPTAPKQ
jgi:2-polyprenyl-6-hydroxyphenyl methylase/3-demethylubiquinone-9 3-methyltransferase